MRSLSPPTQQTRNESATADDLSRTPRVGDMCPLQPGPSQLSASRPQPPVQQLAAFSLDTPSSSRPPSPGSPALQHEPVQPPTLLSTLSANDGESILVLAVDDVKQGGMASALNGSTADSNKGRVYGGSQGGAIHVSRLFEGIEVLHCYREVARWLFEPQAEASLSSPKADLCFT